MRKRALLFGIHADPPRWLQMVYIAIPLIIVLLAYHEFSSAYLVENPRGKLLPSYAMMLERFSNLASIGGHLWGDTAISLARLATGLLFAALVGLLFGLNIALFPGLHYLALPWIVALSFVPVVAILPILLVALGIGEEAKIALIFLGLVFFIIRGLYGTIKEIPQELLIKARTLGATELGLAYRVVLPMIMPNLLEAIRLNLGTAWFCLMMGEAIAAQQGLAYRIFLFRRVGPDMAGIIPYVIWITLLAFCIYALIVWVERKLYPWKQER